MTGAPPATPRSRTLPLWAFLVACVAMVGGASYSYRQQTRAIEAERYAGLDTVAALKIGQIVSWRKERLKDAQLHATGMARGLFLELARSPADRSITARLLGRLEVYRTLESYENVIVARPDGRIVLSTDASPAGAGDHGPGAGGPGGGLPAPGAGGLLQVPGLRGGSPGRGGPGHRRRGPARGGPHPAHQPW